MAVPSGRRVTIHGGFCGDVPTSLPSAGRRRRRLNDYQTIERPSEGENGCFANVNVKQMGVFIWVLT